MERKQLFYIFLLLIVAAGAGLVGAVGGGAVVFQYMQSRPTQTAVPAVVKLAPTLAPAATAAAGAVTQTAARIGDFHDGN